MKRKIFVVFLTLTAVLCLCLGLTACGAHDHVAQQYSVDDTKHWMVCKICDKKYDIADHVFDADGTCEVCGYSRNYTKGLQYASDGVRDYKVVGIGSAGGESSIVIPAYYEGERVSEIGVEAFKDQTGIKSVTIPHSVDQIDRQAFSGCTALESVTIPNSVAQVEGGVFSGCSSLAHVEFEENGALTSIGNAMFKECSALTEIEIPNGITSIHSGAFTGCASLKSVTLPASLTLITHNYTGDRVFDGCEALQRVNITDLSAWCRVEFEGNEDNPLYYAKHLYLNGAEVRELAIPSDIKEVKPYTFYNCESITNIAVSDSVTLIGRDAFYNTGFYKQASNWENGTALYIGNHLIKVSYTISGSYSVRENTKTIAGYACSRCRSLTAVTIPEGVETIGAGAFSGCESLTAVTIPDTVVSIGNDAFDSTGYSDTASNWENGALYIGNHLIQVNITTQGEFSVRENTITIADYAFWNCEDITAVTIPDSVVSIGNRAFGMCDKITSFTIGSGVRMIGTEVFTVCNALSSVTFLDTEGWRAVKEGEEPVEVDVSDPSDNAHNLKYNYEDYVWEKVG